MDRRDFESRIDDLVQHNRFTIAVLFPTIGILLLAGSAEGLVPPPVSFNPYLILLGALVMRLPLVGGLAPVINRRGAVALLVLMIYTYGIEFIGVQTGHPYGDFEYLIELGPMLGGLVPAGLPVFFFPLVVNAYLLVLLFESGGRVVRGVATIGTVLVLDLVLDPAAVSLGFWAYTDGGMYYNVPVTNYIGWILSGTVAVALLEWGLPTAAVKSRLRSCDYMLDDMVSFVILWGGINAYYSNIIPLLLAGSLFGLLYAADRFDIPPPWHHSKGV